MCLLYTLECKLTSQWNKVGSYLVKGQNFLSSTENVNAIKMNIKEIYGIIVLQWFYNDCIIVLQLFYTGCTLTTLNCVKKNNIILQSSMTNNR